MTEVYWESRKLLETWYNQLVIYVKYDVHFLLRFLLVPTRPAGYQSEHTLMMATLPSIIH